MEIRGAHNKLNVFDGFEIEKVTPGEMWRARGNALALLVSD